MKIKIISLIIAITVSSLINSCSNSGSNIVNNSDEGGVYSLKLSSSDIAPWKQQSSDGYISFNATTLKNKLQDMATLYTDEGMLNGFIQTMSNAPKIATVYMMDFGTDSNAIAMYKIMGTANKQKVAIVNYDSSIAQLDNSPSSGVTLYAHFKHCFFQVFFTEFSTKADAQLTAATFLKVFETKIAQLK